MCNTRKVSFIFCALLSLIAVTFCSQDNQEDNEFYRWGDQWSLDDISQFSRPVIKIPFTDLMRYGRLKKTNAAPPPPGFVGARGRRNNAAINDLNDIISSNVVSNLADDPNAFTAWLKQQRPSGNKKSDMAMYKDGFIGARG